MAGEYLGEVRLFGGNYAPPGYVLCNGQLLPVSEYPELFKVLGAQYGGDGEKTFGVPELRGRVPLHMGQGKGLSNRVIAEMGGIEAVALTADHIPEHQHSVHCNPDAGDTIQPEGAAWAAASAGAKLYAATDATTTMSPQCIVDAGESAPHENMPPFLAVTFIMAVQGLVPPN